MFSTKTVCGPEKFSASALLGPKHFLDSFVMWLHLCTNQQIDIMTVGCQQDVLLVRKSIQFLMNLQRRRKFFFVVANLQPWPI